MSLFLLSGCLFPTKPGKGLEHFNEQAPQLGDKAPNFVLHTLSGESIELDTLVGDKPIVLQLGSHTCPVYRYRRFGMKSLYERYQEQVHFLLIYTLEAHPVGSASPYSDKEWVSLWNRIPGVLVRQHANYQQRVEQALRSRTELADFYRYPYLVDTIDNQIWRQYGSAASPAYVIDREGKIVLRQAWVNPREIERSLTGLLNSKP